MKFATIGHLIEKKNLNQLPNEWIHENLIYSQEIDINGTKGNLTALFLTAKQIMNLPKTQVRKKILDAAVFVQNNLNVNLIQLGALTTSVTSGGKWLVDQKEYTGFVNHGDSYTAAVTCQAVLKAVNLLEKNPSELILAVVGAYGVIGEAVSKILVPEFSNSFLIGRKLEKLKKLEEKIRGNFETSIKLDNLKKSDVIVTATSHPTALLTSNHLKKNAIIIDVSQPPNVNQKLCQNRTDIIRVDGGYVNFQSPFFIPGMPKNKLFACVAEVIMQAMENEYENHVGSIDLQHLEKTINWGKKYGFTLNELTNFGKKIIFNKYKR